MPLPDEIELLCIAVQKRAEKEAEQLIDSARKEAEDMVRRAKNQARRILEEKKQAIQRQVLQQARKIIDSAELEARKKILAAREEIFKLVLKRGMEGLASIKSDETRYLDLIKKMVSKAASSLPEGKMVIKVSGNDSDFFKKHLEELQKVAGRTIEISPDTAPISGGLLAYNSDKRVLMDLSFDSMLRTVEPRVRKMVAEKVFQESTVQ